MNDTYESTSTRADHKADFADVYVQPEPRAFFRALSPLDYQIPQNAMPIVTKALSHFDSPATVLDVCCSFGINAALWRTNLSLAEFSQHCMDPRRSELSAAQTIAEDTALVSSHTRVDAPRVLGLDISKPAVDYAIATGLMADGWAEDLEANDPSTQLAAALSDVDLVVCTGGIGYIGAATFRRIAAASPHPERLAVIAFVLRMYDYQPIADALHQFGLVTDHHSEISVRQRRFASDDERRHAIATVTSRGMTTANLENDGWYYADCFVTHAPGTDPLAMS